MSSETTLSDASVTNAYDEVPYESLALVETYPDRLATIALLHGLEPAPVAEARVLELGCASGGNLIPMAMTLPGTRFVGVDLSQRQVDDGREAIKAIGLKNIELRAMSLEDVGADFGLFDYIICHGVYSWVPEPIQGRILEVCARNLAPNGVAYASYNTYPGWHVAGMIREMMVYRVRKLADPNAQVREARAFLDFLAQAVPDQQGLYARVVREEVEQLRPHADSYVLHEHLEEINQPIYFHQFMEKVEPTGLKHLGDARYWSTAVAQLPAVATRLDRLSADPIEREQYLDLLINRRFRRTLLCHADAPTTLKPSADVIARMRASAVVWPQTPVDARNNAPTDFVASDGSSRVTTGDPGFKAVLAILAESWPRSLPFETLWTLSCARRGQPGEPLTPENRARLTSQLLQGYAAHSVELHTLESPFAEQPSEKPLGHPYARRRAAEGALRLPNLRHCLVTPSDFDRLVLRQLDGKRDRAAIVSALVDAVSKGEFVIHQNGAPLKDPAVTGPILSRSLEPSLRRLAATLMLVH